jgi:hypothetical protein
MSKMDEATYQRKSHLVDLVDNRMLSLIETKDIYSTEKYWIITVSENYAHASNAKYSCNPSYEEIPKTVATIKYDESHSLEELQLVFTKAIYNGTDECNHAIECNYFNSGVGYCSDRFY